MVEITCNVNVQFCRAEASADMSDNVRKIVRRAEASAGKEIYTLKFHQILSGADVNFCTCANIFACAQIFLRVRKFVRRVNVF